MESSGRMWGMAGHSRMIAGVSGFWCGFYLTLSTLVGIFGHFRRKLIWAFLCWVHDDVAPCRDF